jgi:nucleotide-binding universal stress UspA family protein
VTAPGVVFPQVVALVSVDPPEPELVDALAALAERGGISRVILLHVEERERLFGPRSSPLRRLAPPHGGTGAFEALLAEVAGRLGGVEVVGIATTGRTTEEVARVLREEDADLLALSRGVDESGRPGWGPHRRALLRMADCPVLLVPPGADVSLDAALVGMDFSDSAGAALRVAMRICPHVRAVAVVDVVAEGLGEAEVEAEVRSTWRARVLADPAASEPRREPVLTVVASSSPADALLAAARETDLLVVGSRGLTPLAAVLLGSTAERLGGRCRQPLLVDRPKGEHHGLFTAILR